MVMSKCNVALSTVKKKLSIRVFAEKALQIFDAVLIWLLWALNYDMNSKVKVTNDTFIIYEQIIFLKTD